MPSRGPGRLVGLVAVVMLAVAPLLTGCGVTGSDPTDIGKAYAPPPPAPVGTAPLPTATTPDALVLDFLDAAVGGGDTGVNQVSRFFTKAYRAAWQPPADKDSITVIRVVGPLILSAHSPDRGAPIDVTYQIVGTLTDDGRVDDVALPRTQRMRFWVRGGEPSGSLRIDGIDALDGSTVPSFMLRDDALNESLYREQSIYFWDTTRTVLVPDVRYVPNTIQPASVAYQVVNWLVSGPAQPGQHGSVLPLPLGIAQPERPSIKAPGSTIEIKLTAPAGGQSPDSAKRLLYQLQASLRPYSIEVTVGTTVLHSSSLYDYQQYELSSTLPPTAQKYDIADGVVQPAVDDNAPRTPNRAVLGVPVNKNVIAAGINRTGNAAAFVRRIGPITSLAIGLSNARVTWVPAPGLPGYPSKVGRPVWIPGSDLLLVPWGGELYRVTAAGGVSLIPVPGSVSAVAISPDGRRVAILVDGRVRIGLLSVDHNNVSLVGDMHELVVDTKLTVAGVAWQSEQQLYIAGSSAGHPALWQVSADGVIAMDRSKLLTDLVPTDVVAFPSSAFAPTDNVVVQCGESGPYQLTGGPQVAKDSSQHPFFVN